MFTAAEECSVHVSIREDIESRGHPLRVGITVGDGKIKQLLIQAAINRHAMTHTMVKCDGTNWDEAK